MLHILLTVLSVIGIILLVILGVLVFLVLALLFVPVCYRGHLVKRGNSIQAGLKVSWMFRLVYVKIAYEGGKPAVKIYIFGIPVLALKRYLDQKKEKKSGAASRRKHAHKKPTVPPGGYSRRENGSPGGGPAPLPKVHLEGEKPSARAGIFRKLLGIPGKIRRAAEKFWFTTRSICAKIKEWYSFFTSKTFKKAWKAVKYHGGIILRHVLPGKVSGFVRFGLSDPGSTGQAAGLLSLFLPLIPQGLQVIPDFQEQCLEADVSARGRIVIFVLLRHGLAVYRDKYVQRVIKKFQHKEA